ncbi:hypothetical protein MSAN_01057900 [Mycena sanguinolenta]|uniref:Uncharacterized protein n=1 Tax=Mycena sanguinolenta TaxID=230812 RepID=A0A8H6YRS1_9AGAR|nr:hypothetical protein MSAN_01057900 [Mycena sanguinolenta]
MGSQFSHPQKRSLDDRKIEPAAAPLRAKIAQFESKGGVPVPRGKFDSFGSAAPPQQNKQRRELYGNRMKPVWVPSTKVGPSPAVRSRYERRQEGAARTVNKEQTDNHLASPPESPTAESEHGGEHESGLLSPPESPVEENEYESEPPSPASMKQQQEFTVVEEQEAEEDVQPEPPKQEYVYEIPEIRGESDEEDVDDEELVEESVSAPPAIDESSLPDTEPEQITAIERRPSSPHTPSSPPLPPTPPPLSAGPSRVELHVDTGYGTVAIHAPPRISSSPASSPRSKWRSHYGQSTPSSATSSPRTGPPRTSSATSSPLSESPAESLTFSHNQGQTFSSVVYPRVHETPARKAPRIPLPASPSPKYPKNNNNSRNSNNRISNAELLALVANAAALERKLVAGELPADVLKRLSVRPPPVTNGKASVAIMVPVVEERTSRPLRAETPEHSSREEKKHGGGFRNALRVAARSKSRKREKDKDKDQGDSESSHPLPPAPHADSSTWFGDVNWRKLASTSRHKSPPLESAPRTLISTP